MSYHHQPQPLTQNIELPVDFQQEVWSDYLTEDRVDTSTTVDLEPQVGSARSYHVLRVRTYRVGRHEMSDRVDIFSNARFPDDLVIEIKTFG